MCNPYEVYNQFYGANRKRDIRSSYFTRRLLKTWGYAMTLLQGNLGKVKVTGKNSAKFASGPYPSYWEMFEVLTLRKDEGVSWLSTKVIWSRSQTEKVHILRLIVMEKQSFKTLNGCLTCWLSFHSSHVNFVIIMRMQMPVCINC